MAALADKLKALRKAAGLSLSKVAARAGMTKAHVWELERGRAANPTMQTIYRLAIAFDMDPMALAECAFRDCKKSIKTETVKITSVVRERPLP